MMTMIWMLRTVLVNYDDKDDDGGDDDEDGGDGFSDAGKARGTESYLKYFIACLQNKLASLDATLV